MIVDDRESDHRPRVAGNAAWAQPMDTLKAGGPAGGRGQWSGFRGDSFEVDRADATGPACLGPNERRGDHPTR
jgi:hypothetical protein